VLAAGTKLGPYEIVLPIGAGAMGEVYRARDSRLDRSVAIKVLPASFTDDPDRLHRFTQEARAAGQLQHPNILTVFDVGAHDGVPYLVTELLDGETLREAIGEGPIRARRTAELAVQIARGLAVAHEHGIVHRDLKPENLFVTRDGRVVILDFGLAKLTRQGEGGGLADSLAGTITAAGVILGTAGYIAPEQVRGEATDHRVDLFALGAILYEMLAGKRAFHGESPVDTLHAILRTDPPEFAAIGVTVPPALERIVRRCLEKRPEQRYQSARDLAFQLEATIDPTTESGALATMPVRGALPRWAWLAGAGTLLIVATGGALLAPRLLPPAGVDRPMRLQILAPPGATLAQEEYPAFSPDGGSVAFVASDTAGISAVWIRKLAEATARRLEGTENGVMPFWSPDGEFIAYFADAKLKKIPAAGGPVEVICGDAHGRGGSWNQRGDILFARGAQGPLFRVPAAGGEPRPVTTLDSTSGEQAHRFPQFLPDGEHFLLMILGQKEEHAVGFASLRGGGVKKIATSSSGAVYSKTGHLLFTRGGQFLAQRLDPKSGRLAGKPMAFGEAPDASNTVTSPRLSVSGTGEIVHMTARPVQSRLYWAQLGSIELAPIPLPADRYISLAPSPDGSRIAFVRRSSDSSDDIWVADLDRGVTSRLTREGRVGGSLVWAPGGQRLAHEEARDASFDLFVRPATGGEAEPLHRSAVRFKHVTDWSADGHWVVFEAVEQATNLDLWTIDLENGKRAAVYRRTSSNESAGRLTPDGKWLAYVSDESGSYEVYVESFPQPGERVQVSNRGGFAPQWMESGRQLVYIGAGGNTAYAAEISATPSLRASAARLLSPIPQEIAASSYIDDRGRFVVAKPVAQTSPPSMTVLLNWEKLLAQQK
jgi:Tol biopolymer transport system component